MLRECCKPRPNLFLSYIKVLAEKLRNGLESVDTSHNPPPFRALGLFTTGTETEQSLDIYSNLLLINLIVSSLATPVLAGSDTGTLLAN